MKKIKILDILLEIRRNIKYRIIFFSLCVVSLAAPLYGVHFIMPSFTNELIEITEDDATRTAHYLSDNLFRNTLSRQLPKQWEVSRVLKSFNIYKIKHYASNGEITFSTDLEDIGTINTKDYFTDIVAKGGVFTNVVKKGSQSAEDRDMALDVVEIYIPIMKGSTFVGAFELYYDITGRKRNLDLLLYRSTAIAVISSILFFSISILFLFNASRDNLKGQILSRQIRDFNDTLEQKVETQTLEIKINQEITIETLAMLAEYYDSDTGQHLERVQFLVCEISKELSRNSAYSQYLSDKPDYVPEISSASILHDIGKVAIDKAILTKPGKLTKDEFDEMKKHTTIASTLLIRANDKFVAQFQKDSYLALARDIAQSHHEKLNGTGYPLGLSAEDIPLSARIVALVDVYDALRSERSYKKPWTHTEAKDEIIDQKGEHFDPVVVDAFLTVSEIFEKKYNP
jgi:HD-GYP domain-containing protein (c-di-GMP phosphodiesterase class II)